MQKSRTTSIWWLLSLLTAALLLALAFWRFGERWLRGGLLYLSSAGWARRASAELPPAQKMAHRFVAGDDIAAASAVAQTLNSQGMLVTLDYLGESVTTTTEAIDARDEILALLDAIDRKNLNANVSVKLSQLGVKIDPQLALDNMRLLLERARQYNNRVRIDMEESSMVDTTLGLYRTLRSDYGFQNVGVVIQAYLFRSAEDINHLIDEGAWVRLCKGAYAEPPTVAFAEKADTDKNYVNLTQTLLSEKARANGVYTGIATHDEAMVNAAIDYVTQNQIPRDAFEFQMLYGIRKDLQEQLIAAGYQIRIYLPYGTAWHPYFVRRLAERPANLWFFVSNLARN